MKAHQLVLITALTGGTFLQPVMAADAPPNPDPAPAITAPEIAKEAVATPQMPALPPAIERGRLPAVLNAAIGPSGSAHQRFDAGSGLTGWVISSAQGHGVMAYTFNDDTRLIFGDILQLGNDGQIEVVSPVINEGGVPVAKSTLAQPKAPDLPSMWAQAEKSNWFPQGAADPKDKPIVYVFADANCIFCHFAYKALAPYMEKNLLQVRWIPVAVLGPTSVDKAAALLASSEPAADMSLGHLAWKEKGSDGFKSLTPTPEHEAKIKANNAFMAETGAGGTPAFIYKDKAGNTQIEYGMPKLSDLARMLGLEPIKNTDPDLARFE